MNNFCKCLRSSLNKKFEVKAEIFIAKKEIELVHVSFPNPLTSNSFFDEIVRFIEKHWSRRKIFYPTYYFIFPMFNDSCNQSFDYGFLVKDKQKNKRRRSF